MTNIYVPASFFLVLRSGITWMDVTLSLCVSSSFSHPVSLPLPLPLPSPSLPLPGVETWAGP